MTRPEVAARRPPGASALSAPVLGLFPSAQFTVTTGDCRRCGTPDAALGWFRDEVIAVPDAATAREAAAGATDSEERTGSGEPSIGATAVAGSRPSPPPLIWIAAPELVEDARLGADPTTLTVAGTTVPFAIAPRIETNRDYVDASTARFFAERPLRIRGARTSADGTEPLFVARTIWPEDSRLDIEALELEPLTRNETLGTLIEAQAGASDGAFPARLLFEDGTTAGPEPAGRRWAGRTVLALVLTGAQGDDDGAGSGHLAVGTGVLGPEGEWGDWLVNNFYPLHEVSAKGILPATLPMDNYLFDVNSGQLYYRPGYMLVAVLSRPRTAEQVQEALQHEMLAFYCGDVEFDLARYNSTAMTMDPIRRLGWRIPGLGPTSRLAGLVAAPLAALFNRELSTGRDLFAALSAERTRLLPRAAFEVAAHDLLSLASGDADEGGELTRLERALAEDVEALIFVRLPQVPSSRRFGTFPVRSLLGYGARLLSDPLGYESAPEAGRRERPETAARACGTLNGTGPRAD